MNSDSQPTVKSSKQKTHPTPWRIEHLNVPLADTGDYDGLTKILAADGDEVAHWWNADDVEEALAERIVQAANAVETTRNRSVTLNGYQLKAALEFCAPDNDADQLASDVSIQWGEAGHSGPGYYCCCTEYPEEGSISLDEKPPEPVVKTSPEGT